MLYIALMSSTIPLSRLRSRLSRRGVRRRGILLPSRDVICPISHHLDTTIVILFLLDLLDLVPTTYDLNELLLALLLPLFFLSGAFAGLVCILS